MGFKVINIVSIGKMKFKHFLRMEEIVKIIEEGELEWDIINQDSSPQLKARIYKEGRSKTGRKRITITLWQTGSFCISGATTILETRKAERSVRDEIEKIIPRVFTE